MASKKLKNIVRGLSREQLGTELGIHPDSINRHMQRQTPPPHEKRGNKLFFDAPEYQAWMKAEGLTGKPGHQGDEDDALRAARIAKEQALTRRYNQLCDRDARKLIDTEEVKRGGIKVITAARTEFLNLGAVLCGQLAGRDGPDIERMITERVREILEGLARGIEAIPTDAAYRD